MPSFSRPIYDPLDDSDDEDAWRAAEEGDASDGTADDPDLEARLDDEARDALDPALRSGQAHPEEDDDLLGAAFPLGDGVADVAATVWCPHCGEPTDVTLDPGGGAAQEYVEDCAVCCRPWRVTVAYGADGSATVVAEAADA